MRVKIWSKDGLRIIERKYDYKKTGGFNRLIPIDKVVEEVPNVPLPSIPVIPPRNTRLSTAVPTHFRQRDGYSF